ncbi:putative peptidyl-tRNA hydrolase PTRHD1 [Agrilus planipennis]|uniref:peptidyl-tRNA hydrolase n=1 Tax=Agrilus planipennis TaxID=224129 RepID=A0A1W4XI58_AGRPL|nr:putative peptidyl-tRNA hydrolase PTRHD1 [Agrilus planipennis]
MSSTVVQYIIVRSDLVKELGWPIGALIAQACHAVTATMHLFKDDEHLQSYLANLESMHKITLECSSEKDLRDLSEKLTENSIAHHLWIEQPENIPTCIAVKPYPKEHIQKYFKKFNLLK